MGAATLLLGFGILIANIWRDHDAAMEESFEDLREIAMLMEGHTRGTIEANAVILDWIEDQVGQYGLDKIGDEASWRFCERMTRQMSGIQALWVLNADGKAVMTTLQHELPTVDYSDRAYFLHARDNPDRGDFVGPEILGRISGEGLFTISRRLVDAKGVFIGLAEVSLRAAYFQDFYRRLDSSPGAVFAIYKDDGQIVLRMPQIDEAAARRLSQRKHSWMPGNEPSGTVIVVSPVDGINRLLAFRRMPENGLLVIAGIPIDTALAGWRERTKRSLFLSLGALAVILVLASYALQAARQSDEARRMAEQANQSKSTFFASASHDLRQPYQAMRLFWAVTDQKAQDLGDPTLQKAVASLGQAMTSGEELLESLLDIATIEAGHVLPQVTAFPLARIIEAERVSFLGLAEAKGLSFRTVPTTAAVRSDPVLLARILRNLVVNAIKYTDKGGIVVGCRHRGTEVLLQVWDSGQGVPEEMRAAIFEDFIQIGNNARQRSQGLGLGLSVVRRTAQLLGHGVDLRSRLGHGSVFTVVLERATCGDSQG